MSLLLGLQWGAEIITRMLHYGEMSLKQSDERCLGKAIAEHIVLLLQDENEQRSTRAPAKEIHTQTICKGQSSRQRTWAHHSHALDGNSHDLHLLRVYGPPNTCNSVYSVIN